jgi:hypothetical protein
LFVINKILKLFITSNELTVREIVDKLDVSKQMIHLALNKLLDSGKIEKLGRTPKTVYRIIKTSSGVKEEEEKYEGAKDDKTFLGKNFLLISETGNMLEGLKGFEVWCKQRDLPIQKTLNEFIDTKKKYNKFYDKSGIIDGTDKLHHTKGFEEIFLEKLFYLDFYAIERFGKTRLGTLLHYAKQGQNKMLMRLLMGEIAKRIKEQVKHLKADAIAFVPPTIRREVQVMKFIQKNLDISLPVVEIKKVNGLIPVPQKSLSKLQERIINAENTFSVSFQKHYKHVILIDDAVGSGATMNQIAGKILNKDVAKKVSGLAVVGSFKGFDVISDI